MSDWISVTDKLPDSVELKKYRVKVQVGSVDKKDSEAVILGRVVHGEFRFIESDWQRVTHWKET